MKRAFSTHSSSRRGLNLTLAALVGACALAGSATVCAQDTAGTVFGKAPAGDSVTARNTATSTERTVQVHEDGRYSIRALPAGVYSVTLSENGQPVVKHPKVPVNVGRGIKVDFDCTQGACAETASK